MLTYLDSVVGLFLLYSSLGLVAYLPIELFTLVCERLNKMKANHITSSITGFMHLVRLIAIIYVALLMGFFGVAWLHQTFQPMDTNLTEGYYFANPDSLRDSDSFLVAPVLATRSLLFGADGIHLSTVVARLSNLFSSLGADPFVASLAAIASVAFYWIGVVAGIIEVYQFIKSRKRKKS